MKQVRMIVMIVGICLLTACVHNPGDTMNLKQHSGPVKVQSDSDAASPAELAESRQIVPIRNIDHTGYVSMHDVAKAMDLHGDWLKDGSYGVGDYDPTWVFHTGSSKVNFAGHTVQLPAPAVKMMSEMYVSTSGLKKLFSSNAMFAIGTNEVSFFPNPVHGETGASGKSLSFTDAKMLDEHSSMIDFAKKFLGVRYDFGAGNYSDTGTFDCSSFTRYVFERYGVDLPRVARNQAEKGKTVSRDELQTGDLLFFYVPGRFKTNKVVGHVGIYMGNGNMIHSSPKPKDGVQITPINKPYWKETFLFAKRYL
jgi:hypothetical protein